MVSAYARVWSAAITYGATGFVHATVTLQQLTPLRLLLYSGSYYHASPLTLTELERRDE